DRIKPPDLLKNLKRDYAEANHWVPLEDVKHGIVVMSTDPERVRYLRMVDNVFPRSKIVYRVTTERDFKMTLDHFFGADSGAGEPIPLDKLGVLPANMERLKGCISKPYGLFFVCGPTGSGKTTTLHSVLGSLNDVETKIWTAEDPVEITQKGLRQCQMNPKA